MRMKMDGKNGLIEFSNGMSVSSSTHIGACLLLVSMAFLIIIFSPLILAKVIKIKEN